jgi:RNA polymerase sigma-70 factor (ECF subfamily)
MLGRPDPLAHPEPLIRRVYAYAAYVLGDGPDAEDVTSETMERALRYRKSYDPRKGAPTTWLLGIARRCIADRASLPYESDVDAIEVEAAGELERDAVTRIVVREAVAALPLRDRELVALRYGADLSARQIAELLGLKTNAVEVALHRLHAKLRQALAEKPAGRSTKVVRKGSGSAAVSDL